MDVMNYAIIISQKLRESNSLLILIFAKLEIDMQYKEKYLYIYD